MTPDPRHSAFRRAIEEASGKASEWAAAYDWHRDGKAGQLFDEEQLAERLRRLAADIRAIPNPFPEEAEPALDLRAVAFNLAMFVQNMSDSPQDAAERIEERLRQVYVAGRKRPAEEAEPSATDLCANGDHWFEDGRCTACDIMDGDSMVSEPVVRAEEAEPQESAWRHADWCDKVSACACAGRALSPAQDKPPPPEHKRRK